jgi:purine catabolism regulator
VSSPYTLGDLLAQEELALDPLVIGDRARARHVAGAHSIEIERPSSWLGPDWVMLTTGVRLRGSAQAQRELVAELDDAGVAALGFGLDLGFKRVPPAVLEEAEARGFPVFAVPLRTPFREIVGSINRALLSSDLRAYQRLSSMQLYLLDALRDTDPRVAIAGRLATLLHSSVQMISPHGEPVLTAGEAPPSAVRAALQGRPPALSEFDADGWHTVAAPVLGPGDEAQEWLLVATRGGEFANPLTKPVVQAAAPLLAATARLGETERAQERAIRAALLGELLRADGDLPSLATRAASFGIDLTEPARMLVVAGDGAADAAAEALAAAGLVHLGRACTFLVQGPDAAIRAVVAQVLAALPGALAGIGRRMRRLTELRDSHRDAQLALQRLAFAPGERLLSFEDFELGLLLVSEAPPERIQPKVDAWTAPLRANPMLWDAIVAYFEHDQDVPRAAESLHLHPNSLRYRLARVEKLLGRSLKQPSTVAAIYIAMLATGAPPPRAVERRSPV